MQGCIFWKTEYVHTLHLVSTKYKVFVGTGADGKFGAEMWDGLVGSGARVSFCLYSLDFIYRGGEVESAGCG